MNDVCVVAFSVVSEDRWCSHRVHRCAEVIVAALQTDADGGWHNAGRYSTDAYDELLTQRALHLCGDREGDVEAVPKDAADITAESLNQ